MLRFKITVRTHGFHVTVLYASDLGLMDGFKHTLSSYDNRFNYKTKRMVRTLKCTYATYHKLTQTYGFHRNTLDNFLQYLKRNGVDNKDIETTIIEPYVGEKSQLILAENVEPKDYQGPIIDFINENGITKVLPLQTGKGKAQPLDALVRVPGGWEEMRHIHLNDEVISRDGLVSTVIGVFPQGLKDVYEITFSDGRSVECCDEHLWKVYNPVWLEKTMVLSTKRISSFLDAYGGGLMSVDLIIPEDSHDVKLPLDPYTLGFYIGDGYKDSGVKGLTTLLNETEIKEIIKFGLDKQKSYNKSIPSLYLETSIKQRVKLLKGLLMASDLVIETGKRAYYNTYSQTLAKEIQYLVRSLGGLSSIKELQPEYKRVGRKVESNRRYLISMAFNRLGEDANDYRFCPIEGDIYKLRIKHIRYIGRKETQCIAINHPEHLYVTNDFIVTHNTFCALYSIQQSKQRSAIVLSAGHVETWLKDAKWMFTNSEEEFIVIRGKESLVNCIANAQSNTLKASVLIFTVNTIRDYLTEYEDTGSSTYGCNPSELYETLGIDFRVTDEAHENLHFGYRHDIETNVNKALYLSATIKSHDSFTNKLYNIIFPIEKRYIGLEWDKYIVSKVIAYRLQQAQQARYNGAMGYSHNMYEQWLMKLKSRSNGYYKMICDIVRSQFLQTYQPKQKLLIYVSTIDMSMELATYLKKNLLTTLSITAYNGKHEDEVLHNNDIVVSTPKKSGTGKDIKGLVLVISTVSVHGLEITTQMMGRLRKIDDLYPGIDPVFIQLLCQDINTHVRYHQSKADLYKAKVKSIKTYSSNFVV